MPDTQQNFNVHDLNSTCHELSCDHYVVTSFLRHTRLPGSHARHHSELLLLPVLRRPFTLRDALQRSALSANTPQYPCSLSPASSRRRPRSFSHLSSLYLIRKSGRRRRVLPMEIMSGCASVSQSPLPPCSSYILDSWYARAYTQVLG